MRDFDWKAAVLTVLGLALAVVLGLSGCLGKPSGQRAPNPWYGD